MRFASVFTMIAFAAGFIPGARAELSRGEQREAKNMVRGKLYLRIDAPCIYEPSFVFGNVEPLVEVSPTGYKLLEGNSRASAASWRFGPNDQVGYGDLHWSGDAVTVWMEGLPPKRDELMVKFVEIKTLEDFKAAFNRAFAKVPLQDEHPEWPAEIRKAIAERRVVEGMTKRQAFCVVGTPVSTQTGTDKDAEIETWSPRQDNGPVGSFRKPKRSTTSFPVLLKFVNGKLAAIEMNKPTELKLD